MTNQASKDTFLQVLSSLRRKAKDLDSERILLPVDYLASSSAVAKKGGSYTFKEQDLVIPDFMLEYYKHVKEKTALSSASLQPTTSTPSKSVASTSSASSSAVTKEAESYPSKGEYSLKATEKPISSSANLQPTTSASSASTSSAPSSLTVGKGESYILKRQYRLKATEKPILFAESLQPTTFSEAIKHGITSFKIQHHPKSAEFPGFLDTRNKGELFLHAHSFSADHKFYYDQVWDFVPIEKGDYYKIQHHLKATGFSGFLDTRNKDELFLQPHSFSAGHEFYYNQLWEIIATSEPGHYKIKLHPKAGFPGYLDTRNKDELFLQPYSFPAGHEFYYNQLWEIIPQYSKD